MLGCFLKTNKKIALLRFNSHLIELIELIEHLNCTTQWFCSLITIENCLKQGL
jgi:hypothetical protein